MALNDVSVVETEGGGRSRTQVLFRDGAFDKVTVLQEGAGEGVWLPESTAQYLGVGLGDPVTFGVNSSDGTTVVFPVVGIYRDLFREEPVRPYWCLTPRTS